VTVHVQMPNENNAPQTYPHKLSAHVLGPLRCLGRVQDQPVADVSLLSPLGDSVKCVFGWLACRACAGRAGGVV